MSEWEPIETAPRNGETVWVALPDGVTVLPAYYDRAWFRDFLLPQFKETGSAWCVCAAGRRVNPKTGRYEFSWFADTTVRLTRPEERPTHWCLPKPPTQGDR